MDVKLELLAGVIADTIKSSIQHIHIDANDVINSVALITLEEIAQVIQNEAMEDDFAVVEEIVCILEKYNIDTGGRHDF